MSHVTYFRFLKYHKVGLTPTTPVTLIAISPVKMSIGRKSLTNLHSGLIFLQGKPVFLYLPVFCSFAYLRWRRRDVCNLHMFYIDDIIHNSMCVIF
jgi:hypothetical protein